MISPDIAPTIAPTRGPRISSPARFKPLLNLKPIKFDAQSGRSAGRQRFSDCGFAGPAGRADPR